MSELDARASRREEWGEEVDQTAAGSGDTDLEAPDADAAEQRAPVGHEPGSWTSRSDFMGSFDVNEADVADQQRAVELDEDDYR